MHRYIRPTRRPFTGSPHLSQTIRPVTFTTLIIAIIFCSSLAHTKPFKSHRCLDWRFGGWSPMLYSLQPSVSPPIYHRPQQSYPPPEQLSKQTSANYVKKLRPSTQNWQPYQSNEEQGQAKVVRYNVRKPSNYAGQYPKYPQYLPTTVLRLKPVKPNNYQSGDYQQNYHSGGGKMNAYPVPIQANYAVKNIYSQQPVIYEQLDYQTSSRYPSPSPAYPSAGYQQAQSYPQKPSYPQAPSYPQKPSYPQAPSYPQTPNYRPSYPVKSPQQPAYQPPPPPNKPQYPPKPAKTKTTVAAYIPVLQVPAIEAPAQKPKIEALPVLNIKKPLAGYEEKIVEEHIYQIPNHMLHEMRHEVHGPPKPIYPTLVIAHPEPAYQPAYQPAYRPHRPIGQAVSHMHQSFGTHYLSHGPPHGMPEIPKPQISYDTHYKPDDGPPVVEMPYQMDNYAKAEDAGLFKPLLDRTRQSNQFPKVGAMPYKDNDPENLNVIHLIANQKHLPLVVPITSIHVSNDGSYPVAHNERPIMEKQIPSYSEMPIHHQKPPQPYGPANHMVGGDASYTTSYEPPKIEQEKSGYVEEEKMILQQLNAKPEEQYPESYKEPQPQYVIHQEYNPVPSVPDLPSPPEAGQYQVSNDNQQVIEQVKVSEEYPPQYPQQGEVKGTEYTVQQQEVKGGASYPVEPIEQIKEPALPQIQQITTEYIKHEEPKQQTDSYNQPPPYVQQVETPVQVQEVQVKESYPTQDYKVKGAEEYGRRVPATNYQYVKPSNLPVQSYEQQSGGYSSQSSYPAQSSYPQANDQSYSQQQVESQKTSSVDGGSREQLSEEQANIAAYEEARKSILQNSYTPLVYQQPSSYQEQVSYQPPLSTAYDTKSEKASDYTDDYSYRAESKDQAREEVKSTGDRVYDLPSNTAEKVVTVNGGQSEILSSEEQTKKSSYEILPEQKTVVSVVTSVSSSADEKQLADAKSDNGQKYGERLVYVKSPKFKNLRTVNGNTYLGDTLLYSASTRSNSNSTLRRHRENGHRQPDDARRSSRIRAEVIALSSSSRSSSRSASTRSPPVRSTTSDSSSASSTDIEKLEKLEVVTIGSELAAASNKSADQTETGKSDADKTSQTNSTEASKSTDDEQVVNYVKPVSRAALRNLRLKKLKKDEEGKEGKLSSTAELSSSASEQFESKVLPEDAVLDLTNLDVEELASNLKAEETEDLEASGSENVASSQLYHAYYGPPNHQPEPGYVRLTVQQFKEIFKDAEIHVLKSDQNTQLASSSSASPANNAELTASSTATPPQA